MRSIDGATPDADVRYASSGSGGAATSGGAGSKPRVATPPRARDSKVFLQVGAFGEKDNAKRLEQRLEKADIDDVSIDRERVSGRTVHRVRIGPLAYHQAESVAARVRQLGFTPVTVTAD